MINKFKIESNDSMVFHMDTDREIYFSIKDVNQKETMVSISEVYRALQNVETLLGGFVDDDTVIIKTPLANAYGTLYFIKEKDNYYMTLDNYGGGSKVSISKEMFEETRKIAWSDSEYSYDSYNSEEL